MIMVNGKDFQWEEGLTVKILLEKKKYVYPLIVVKVNGKYIPPDEYENTIIKDGDDVKAIHMLSGG